MNFPTLLIVSAQALEGNPIRNSKALALMAEAGAIIIHSNPFRESNLDDHLRLFPRSVHGVEIYNGISANHWEFPADVVIILAVVLINAILGVCPESKAEQAIEALQQIAAATSKVIRDGKQITVKSEDLVVGDIIVLEAGDSVPADARIIECASMKIEEAALTGESVPVDKGRCYRHRHGHRNG